MTPEGGWGSTTGDPRPYAPPAEPGPLVEGLTGDWSAEMAKVRRMHAEKLAAEREAARPRHARGHVFLAAVARGVGTALIALGELVSAAGTAVRGIGVRHLP